MNSGAYSIAFAPLVPWAVIGALGLVALAILGFGGARRARGMALRAIAFATGLLALANPSLLQEERDSLSNVAIVIADKSTSQNVGERTARTEAAVTQLQKELAAIPNLEVRVLHAGGENGEDGTQLFTALDRALQDVPPNRVAGAIIITDGEVHDAPDPANLRAGTWKVTGAGPVHVLLSGDRNEADRRLVVTQAPTYGMVGTTQSVKVRVDDPTAPAGTLAQVKVTTDGTQVQQFNLPVGAETALAVTVQHEGQTVLEIETNPGQRELTLQNNRSAVVINGVRDRLRVLLVSGEPHAGERTWRNLLKADPSVDLVHFTILRPPEKQDATPIRELSLIAFPVRELFEEKLKDFDLVIFDRYEQQGVIPRQYLQNVADYVANGGAVLEAAGPEFESPLSLYTTPIAAVLPASPNGRVSTGGFIPKVTDVGNRHPVTADLPGADDTKTPWGRWFRLVGANPTKGQVLMSGTNGLPLLVLDHVGQGRVAQLLSDQAWLWTRGYEGGGPQAELFRRVAHWLMKEPDLEEESLRATGIGSKVGITRRTLNPDPPREVTVTRPDGTETKVALEAVSGGRSTGALAVDAPGLYKVTDGTLTALAAVGTLNPKENEDLRTTDKIMTPVATATAGDVVWLGERGTPDVRMVREGRDASGRGWIGLRDNESYVVAGVAETPLLPVLLALMLLAGGLVTAWYREGR